MLKKDIKLNIDKNINFFVFLWSYVITETYKKIINDQLYTVKKLILKFVLETVSLVVSKFSKYLQINYLF